MTNSKPPALNILLEANDEACTKYAQWNPGNKGRYCQNHFWLWQQQINTHHPVDDRMVADNEGIIVNTSTRVCQEESFWDQATMQARSTNPVDPRRENNGIIVNESIRIQEEESICCFPNQHCQGEPPKIIPREWKQQQTIMTMTLMHPLAFSKRKRLSLHQARHNFLWMRIGFYVKP